MAELIRTAVSEGVSLTAVNEDGQLIAREAATREKFTKRISLTIDGHKVSVFQSVPATDFLGNVIREADGLPKPRNSTIYDAAKQLVTDQVWTQQQLEESIPVLCHKDHLNPIAVCRMCSVHVCKYSRGAGKFKPNDKLIPACQHEVQDGILVTTRNGSLNTDPKDLDDRTKYAKQVTSAITLVTEMLVAENLRPAIEQDKRGVDELQLLGEKLNVTVRPSLNKRIDHDHDLHAKSRYEETRITREQMVIEAEPGDTKADVDRKLSLAMERPYSARSILVDHDRCILCDRCSRSCSDVKPFKIIGHTGKGYKTRISFDLDAIMNDSNCVQCGECMTSCPTGALTLRRRVAPPVVDDQGKPVLGQNRKPVVIATDPGKALPQGADLPEGYEFLTADEMVDLELDYNGQPFKPFATIPYAFLKWNEGAVRRRVVKAGTDLCRFGDFGSTAFLLKSGTFDLLKPASGKLEPPSKPGFFGRLFGGGDPNASRPPEECFLKGLPAQAFIMGELAALSSQPRKATIRVATDAVVYEISRNILDMAQRSPSAREVFNKVYTKNAIASCLRSTDSAKGLFVSLEPADQKLAMEILSQPGAAKLFRYDAGQMIIRDGDRVVPQPDDAIINPDEPGNDYLYIIRRGYVKFVVVRDGAEKLLNWYAPENQFGEIAYLSDHELVKPLLPKGYDPGRRTASAIAMDPVEVIQIPGWLFRKLLTTHPQIRDRLAEQCARILAGNRLTTPIQQEIRGEFLDQGLFQAQKMLVLNLKSCTRCDECTKACADSHEDGISRLLREGQRFGDYLVTTSCRSCHKTYCMEGCPVDAIHRKGTQLEVIIDNHCIGCGLCESNCPYGAIQMVPKHADKGEMGMTAKVEKRAVNCDLCHGLIPAGADTFCVAACPHDAAFRWSGEKLLEVTKTNLPMLT